MKATVYGIQRKVKWSYQGREGFNQRLHLVYPEEMNNNETQEYGFRVESLKVPGRVDLSKIKVNDMIEIYYNRYGQVESVVKI